MVTLKKGHYYIYDSRYVPKNHDEFTFHFRIFKVLKIISSFEESSKISFRYKNLQNGHKSTWYASKSFINSYIKEFNPDDDLEVLAMLL